MKVINNKGFTLVQLIVVVAIILVLTAIVLFGGDGISRTGKAKDVQRYQDVTAIAKAVELYQIDNDALPDDLSATSISVNEKYVLCSDTAEALTCDGQEKTCLFISEVDFLNNYLGGSLPVDPEKTAGDNHTGYYVTRTDTKMTFGACDTYEDDDIEYIAKANIDYVCGDGITDATEVYDDGNTITEGCGDGIISLDVTETTFSNSDCSAYAPTIIETCDYNAWTYDCSSSSVWYTYDDTVYSGTYCNATCTGGYSGSCDPINPPDDQ